MMYLAIKPVEVEIPALDETRTIGIVMNAASFSIREAGARTRATATEVSDLITNVAHEKATCEWIIKTYSNAKLD